MLVSVFRVRAHPISGTTDEGSERGNPVAEWGTPSGGTSHYGEFRLP